MKSKCHKCGREYLVARALAGTAVACRGCGAHNDGAGGPPPAQQPGRASEPPAGARGAKPSAGRASSRRDAQDERIFRSGFEVGANLPLPEPPPDEVLPPPAPGAKPAASVAQPREPGAIGAAIRRFVRVALVALTFVLLAGVTAAIAWFAVGSRETAAGGLEAWQRAVPQVVGELAASSGFVVEHAGEWWLVTDCRALEGSVDARVLFKDPVDGRVLAEVGPIEIGVFRVHGKFLSSLEGGGEARRSDIAVASLERWRGELAVNGVMPLALAGDESVRTGLRIAALGHPLARRAPETTESDAVRLRTRDDAWAASYVAIRDGLVARAAPPDDGPAVLMTSIDSVPGLEGGPVVRESDGCVLAVMPQASIGGGAKDAPLAVTASVVREVLGSGIPVESLRETLVARSEQPAPVTAAMRYEEEAWPAFPALRQAVSELEKDGWRFAASRVLLADEGGRAESMHSVAGSVPAEVAVVLFPRDAAVRVDLHALVVGGKPAAGQLRRLHGFPLLARVCVPASGGPEAERMPLMIAAGSDIGLVADATFAGAPIEAQFVVVYLERSVPDSTAPPVPSQPPPQASAQPPSPGANP